MRNVRVGGARWVGVAVVVGVVAGCTSASVDKQGANTSPAVRTLKIGMPDYGFDDPGSLAFVKAVEERSKGRIRLEVDASTYVSSDPKNEAKLIADLKVGAIDGGYPASRGYAAVGVPSFVLLQTPFLLSTLDAEVQFAQSPVADTVLADLRSHGVEGLALVPNEVRQLLTREPWFGNDLKGAKIRVVDNPHTSTMVTQLGGTPVQGLQADEVEPALRAGTLDGVESSPFFFAQQAYHEPAPFVTGFGIQPKFQVVAIANRVWSSLTAEERETLRAAARDAVAAASKDVSAITVKYLSQACEEGAVIEQPAPALLSALAQKSVPIGADQQLLAQLRASVPLAGPRLMTVPSTCRIAATPAQATALAAAKRGATTPGKSLAPSPGVSVTFPTGTYTNTNTVAEFEKNGAIGEDWSKDITWTLIFRPDGSYRQEQKPDYPDQGPVEGRWETKGDVLTVTYHFVGEPDKTIVETVRWTYHDGSLRFTEVAEGDRFAKFWWMSHPWRRVK